MASDPKLPRIVHPLPAAPAFHGRDPELRALHSWWADAPSGVVALVGLGGAGKTALASRFLQDLPLTGREPAGGLFVWSFYQEPDAGLFLRELYAYLVPDEATAPARGAGLLHLLAEALGTGGQRLLVLDGLERVQRQEGPAGGYGQVEDPLLKGLLLRIAAGLGETAALVSSRFPVTDLAPFADRGYRHLDVEELDRAAAVALLRARGVRGSDEALGALVDSYGGHALTLDHLGGLVGQFLGGDPARAPEAPALSAPGADRQALRLARLLSAYETHLPPAELALLCRLCLLRRSVAEAQFLELFLCSPPIPARAARELVEAVKHLPLADDTVALWMASLTGGIRDAVEEAQCAGPLAGPEAVFRQEVLAAAAGAMEARVSGIEVDIDAFALPYVKSTGEVASERLPLPVGLRGEIEELYARYTWLRDHPLQPFKGAHPLMVEAFNKLGWKKPWPPVAQDLEPVDVLRQLQRVRERLHALAAQHAALQRVRELCRLHQEKWALAGPLAPLGAAELRDVLASLVGRHLVLREADGSLTAHPAVRDHFARLGAGAERGRRHDVLRLQLVSLARRPGVGRPEDPATLDLVEEAIHHAREAGRHTEAVELYEELLGGLRHLGWRLGEAARGLRILRGFDPCPDRSALGWFLRALGEFDEAYRQNEWSYFRADVRLLQGRLPEAERERDEVRSAVAAFLMGESREPPAAILGCAVPRAQILLYLGRLAQAQQATRVAPLYGDLGWEGERARCALLSAEAARRQGDAAGCGQRLDEASGWMLHSGSVEHLCLLHLVRSRADYGAGRLTAAGRDAEEGVHLARRCGLRLFQVELLCAMADGRLADGDAPAAERAATDALAAATDEGCRFAWGEAEARHLIGASRAAQSRPAEAREMLVAAYDLRQRIGDPRGAETERLLARLG